ncbi:hypothetical protein PED38_11105 [Clavibacter sp. CT19]|uniref:hypothetical protein n=1 Tax=Clavibacter sp. CT19 TaxID=3018990 RepID=UPI0022EBA204|nr:hypothetical protein [Clavibacter sp. CT19]MDA3805346.1 hypothetical protein [Clavibacter sp. CT19]
MLVPSMIPSLSAAVVRASASYIETEGINVEGLLRYFGVLLIIMSISALAYTGLWRWWSKMPFMIPLGVGWLAAGQIISNIGLFFGPPLGYAFLIPGAIVSLFGIYGMGFMPRPFLPRWYRLDWGIDPSRVVHSAGRRLLLVPRGSHEVDLAERGRSISSPAVGGAGSPLGSAPIETCDAAGGGTFLGAFIGGAVTAREAAARGSVTRAEATAARIRAFAP